MNRWVKQRTHLVFGEGIDGQLGLVELGGLGRQVDGGELVDSVVVVVAVAVAAAVVVFLFSFFGFFFFFASGSGNDSALLRLPFPFPFPLPSASTTASTYFTSPAASEAWGR